MIINKTFIAYPNNFQNISSALFIINEKICFKF